MQQQGSAAHPFAVVTGGSSGIGFELAKQFGEHGYDVLIVAEDAGVESAAESLRATGASVEALRADLATYEGVEKTWEHIRRSGRQLDAIALNAGVGLSGAFAENDLQAELRMIDLDVKSVVHLAKYVVRDMLPRNEGKILFTSSIAADMPGPFLAVYAASKAFVQWFAQALRNELKDTNITVTALQPGPTDTNFFARAEMEDTPVAQKEKDDPAEVARQGFEALMKGKDHVFAASLKTKMQGRMAQVMSEEARAAMHRKDTEPEAR